MNRSNLAGFLVNDSPTKVTWDFQISLLRVYSINSMDSQSFHICRMQCNWIQSLKRHSILISESGEMQRMDFLQKQQAIIDSL